MRSPFKQPDWKEAFAPQSWKPRAVFLAIAYIWGMYRFVYSLRLLLWWLAVAMPLGAYAGDDTRSELVEVLRISEDISISSNHIGKGVSDIVTLDKGLFRSQVDFDIIYAYSTWRHPHSSDRIQTSGDIAVRFIGRKGSYYDSSTHSNIGDGNKATFYPFVQGDVGNELLKLTPPLFNGDQGKQFLFRQDFEQDYNTLMRILDDGLPGGKVKAWEKVFDNILDDALRKNGDALINLSNSLDEGLDAIDAVEDAIQTLNKSKWEDIKALFKRGNDFNRKARTDEWYDYHEIHLANGKRFDSYDPDIGEIVSRKATDFDNIQSSTFENYLKEIDIKYAPGTTIIRSNKYPDIDGQALQGSNIL